MSTDLENNNNKPEKSGLTKAQKERIEKNRLKALSLKAAKVVAKHPYSNLGNKPSDGDRIDNSIIRVQNTKYVDSGGGFLIEQATTPVVPPTSTTSNAGLTKEKEPVVDTLQIPITYHECVECGGNFVDSYLLKNFDYYACDNCHKHDGLHALITKTEAKSKYLLKDCDLEQRPPPLRCINRKNPHSMGGGDMKLYLHLQVEQRAVEVWGSMEELERQFEIRSEKSTVAKIRKYNKKMKELRMEMRSSLYTKKINTTHVHEYGEEVYNEKDDTYTHVCKLCSFKETYEKM